MSHHDEHYDREVIKHDPKEGFDPTEPHTQRIVTFVVGSVVLLLAVIFALLAFGQLFGFTGILLALPASAALLVWLRLRRLSRRGSLKKEQLAVLVNKKPPARAKPTIVTSGQPHNRGNLWQRHGRKSSVARAFKPCLTQKKQLRVNSISIRS